MVFNGVIEEELSTAAAHNITNASSYIGDYSPFAVAEFRDWLRHRGETKWAAIMWFVVLV